MALRTVPEGASPWRWGYADGCLSGRRSAFGRLETHRDQHRFRTDDQYRAGWQAGFEDCRKQELLEASYTPTVEAAPAAAPTPPGPAAPVEQPATAPRPAEPAASAAPVSAPAPAPMAPAAASPPETADTAPAPPDTAARRTEIEARLRQLRGEIEKLEAELDALPPATR